MVNEKQQISATEKPKTKPGFRGTPFPTGVSGNPNGRPKGAISIVALLKQKLAEVNPETKKTFAEEFTEVMYKKAVKDKDVAMIRDIVNRIDGMPMQNANINNNLKINVVFDNSFLLDNDDTSELIDVTESTVLVD